MTVKNDILNHHIRNIKLTYKTKNKKTAQPTINQPSQEDKDLTLSQQIVPQSNCLKINIFQSHSHENAFNPSDIPM